jgi:hypothetical protein
MQLAESFIKCGAFFHPGFLNSNLVLISNEIDIELFQLMYKLIVSLNVARSIGANQGFGFGCQLACFFGRRIPPRWRKSVICDLTKNMNFEIEI